jgi:alpha-D-ribose 1-methylphosphonate 5-triphosphate diphosphatase
MDHTPGQGQYADESDWRNYYTSVVGASADELEERLAMKRAGQSGADYARSQVALVAGRIGAALASHDDDSPASVQRALDLGARISEFPVNLEAAQAARQAGLGVVMGAPNARRGGSHLANLSARQALEAGCLDVLASDYHPPSLLAAIYMLADDGACSWAEAAGLATANPAQLAKIGDRGCLAPGMQADMLAVARRGGQPVVAQVWIEGRMMLGVQPRQRAA